MNVLIRIFYCHTLHRSFTLAGLLLFGALCSAQSVATPVASSNSAISAQIGGDLNASTVTDPNAMTKYAVAVRDLLYQQKFDELDKVADTDRQEKAKFSGGVWKLYMLYQGLKQPPQGKKASRELWSNHLDALRNWSLTRPESVTARVALAEALVIYSSKLANDSDNRLSPKNGQDPWTEIFSMRHLADLTMKEVAGMPTKCPHFYFVKLELQEEKDQDAAEPVFEEAISFAPDYFPYYRVYALHLRPEWGGDDGDAEKFADETATRVGGKQGAAIYFEIAAALNASPSTRFFRSAVMPWDRIQSGYSALEELYGPSLYKLNQFAFLAMKYKKLSAAGDLFAKIGDNWSYETWRSHQYFEYAKEYAMPSSEISALRSKTASTIAGPDASPYLKQVFREVGIKLAPVLRKCSNLTDRGPVRGSDLFVRLAADGTIQEVRNWPDSSYTACISPSLLNARISAPPAPSWVEFPFFPSEGWPDIE